MAFLVLASSSTSKLVGSEATVLENVIPARETTATVREVDALQRIVLENVHCGLEQSMEGPVQVELGAHTVVLRQRVTMKTVRLEMPRCFTARGSGEKSGMK